MFRSPVAVEHGLDDAVHGASVVDQASGIHPRNVLSGEIPDCPEGARLIPLARELFAIVDGADYLAVAALPWTLLRTRDLRYARHWRLGLMHRFLMQPPRSVQVDHINGNGLDNRRVNLRLCSPAQNHQNRRKTGGNIYKGVQALPSGSYRARIFADGELIHLGTFGTPIEAALAYDRAATRSFGKFACVNFQCDSVSHAPTLAGEEDEVTAPRVP